MAYQELTCPIMSWKDQLLTVQYSEMLRWQHCKRTEDCAVMLKDWILQSIQDFKSHKEVSGENWVINFVFSLLGMLVPSILLTGRFFDFGRTKSGSQEQGINNLNTSGSLDDNF